jgi:hypothetical protein
MGFGVKWIGILGAGLVIAIVLGVLFQMAYPHVELDRRLSLLLAVIGLALAVALKAAWHARRRPGAEGGNGAG